MKRIETDMFKDVNSTIHQILELASLKLNFIDKQLENPSLTVNARKALIKDREKLVAQIQGLQKTMAQSK